MNIETIETWSIFGERAHFCSIFLIKEYSVAIFSLSIRAPALRLVQNILHGALFLRQLTMSGKSPYSVRN